MPREIGLDHQRKEPGISDNPVLQLILDHVTL